MHATLNVSKHNLFRGNWNKFDIAEKFNFYPFKIIRLHISLLSLICHLYIGALNTVGRYIVNMTRGQEASITNNNPSENVPDAILTLTKNVLGQNVTKSIEPMIKRIGVVETRDDPELSSPVPPSKPPVNELLLNATESSQQTVDAKKKKKKQKTKRKDQPAEQLIDKVESFTESRKISFWDKNRVQ